MKNENEIKIGGQYLLPIPGGLLMAVEVLSLARNYGRTDATVKPVAGTGEMNVSADRLRPAAK